VTQLCTLLKSELRRKLSALLIQNLDVKSGLPLERKTMTVLEEKSAGIYRNLYNGDLYSLCFSLIIIIIKLLKYRPIYTLFCK